MLRGGCLIDRLLPAGAVNCEPVLQYGECGAAVVGPRPGHLPCWKSSAVLLPGSLTQPHGVKYQQPLVGSEFRAGGVVLS
ncbi:hypothetical protein J2S47_006792 [Streptomyces griseoviridis]|uniref:Uncharacterized protein n=1 Tax=Streptomyces griseoviridis TaxID=45398 RepID=A0ABT9LRX5_STRGD|nr:hypothetical protein [Streptomyces griseoviridis]GGT15912.1 hypothetical protein GCM10010240_56440 [Streptomyces griseoviridis]